MENAFPAITGLCRTEKTASFDIGERVAYFTVSPHRLAAILHIEERFDTHAAAAAWYRARSIALPQNLMVPGNDPLPYELTCGYYKGRDGKRKRPAQGMTTAQFVVEWDALYRIRMEQFPHVRVCRRLFVNLNDPPELTKDMAARVFPGGRFPATQTPKKEDEPVIDAIVRELRVVLRSDAPPALIHS